MKTKILMLLITAAIVLCSCSPKKEICSVDSCSQEVYKDGLCADHYVSATLSESNSDESSAEDIDPVVAALQEQYQEYVDEAISLCRDSLKNPKSLDMADYKIPIDTFIRETFECMASVCAIFSGAALSFQNTRMHTQRNSTELQIMAGSTLLTIPLNSILAIEKLTFPDIKTVEYEITTTEGNTITIDTF